MPIRFGFTMFVPSVMQSTAHSSCVSVMLQVADE